MTPEEFAKRMREIFASGYDPERAHGDADDLLCEVLASLGYKEGVDTFRQATRWYA